ncbi:putative Tco5 histidine kinase [Pleurotus ostreatus PC15]|uniref:histidine kinase n=1 Tax=Pleurotus ostreatus (strain PC15) TaxID=1137138 RepID=A0A067NQY6_PLEO1|nr:putative Tco5 histidine kinase [Pleurotus ostreatus PC15]
MPFWTRSTVSSVASTKWTEDVALQCAEKALDTSVKTTTPSDGPTLPPPAISNGNGSASRKRKSARVGVSFSVHWEKFRRRIGTGTAPSTSSILNESAADSSILQPTHCYRYEDEDVDVDDVVVDRIWSEELKSSVSHSENGVSPEKSGDSHPQTAVSDHESIVPHGGFWASSTALIILRWRVWPAVKDFFDSKFTDEKSEQHYVQENWFHSKRLALWSSVWLAVNWALGCGFVPKPFVLMDKIFYWGVAPALSFPVFFLALYDWPRDRPVLYQCFVAASVWMWATYQVLFMYLCGTYNKERALFDCGTRDFVGVMYYTTALQTIAIFGLKLDRLAATVGATVFFIFSCAAIIPDRLTWTRTMINFAIFHIFMIYVHYKRESAERRVFIMRDQLKVQFKATQKAQVNERKAGESKRRLTSYVRVPLNTALLAVQNMDASGTIAKTQEIEFKALEGSLSMMSKVLNDVLDFNRMDSGRFESAPRPYSFHQAMRSLLIPLRLATDARGLELVINLDPNIDLAARCAAYEAMKYSPEDTRKILSEYPDLDGIVVGDETRLRQIITNLASNACKFTPSGGTLTITTRLILPTSPPDYATGEAPSESTTTRPSMENQTHHSLSTSHLSQHNRHHTDAPPLEWIVVRIEVSDTGCGIRRRDMTESKLFSAFNQTEQGRQQGGKGTGLGLALVRSIVKLSGGRLGVKSKVNEGSTFWVELPLGVGLKTFDSGAVPVLGSEPIEASDFGRLHQLWRADKSGDDTPNGNLPSPGLGSMMSASHTSAGTVRSTAALQGLMDQGGRVEISLDDAHSVPTRTIGDSSTGTQFDLSGASDESPTQGSFPVDNTNVVLPTRPKFVQMPSHISFVADPNTVTPSTNMSGRSGTSPPTSPGMSTFDSNRVVNNCSNHTLPFESGLNVLVVDDDPLTRTLMKRILTRLGCSVSTAENGEVALEMILAPAGQTPSSDGSHSNGPILEQERPPQSQDTKYAVVFLDNSMPVMSGLELVTKLREMDRKDFVVGVTGNALLTDQQEYLEAGVDRVLTKPVLERSLKDVLVIADERRKRGNPSNTTDDTPL